MMWQTDWQGMDQMTCIETLAVVAEATASIIALVLSVVSIKQTRKQIELSNKQSLFDRRLAIYMMTSELMHYFETYPENYSQISMQEYKSAHHIDNPRGSIFPNKVDVLMESIHLQ